MDMEFLLMKTLSIIANKIQMVINNFLQEETYTSIFCFTETKVDSPDFRPVGIKLFTKPRKKKEKKGGDLMIGYKEDKRVVMEELRVDSSDVLAIEGKIRGCKNRIILVYVDSTKKKHGWDYEKKEDPEPGGETV